MRAISSRSTKWYSTPSVSVGRGARVVTEVETQTSGCRRRTAASTASLPTPDGPDSTVSRASGGSPVPGTSDTGPRVSSGGAGAGAELPLEGFALLGTQSPYPAGGRDLQPFHDPRGAGLADARHRLQHRGDPHLADDVVVLRGGEHLGDGDPVALEALLHFRPRLPGRGGLLERGSTLLRGEWREGHLFLLVRGWNSGDETVRQLSERRPSGATSRRQSAHDPPDPVTRLPGSCRPRPPAGPPRRAAGPDRGRARAPRGRPRAARPAAPRRIPPAGRRRPRPGRRGRAPAPARAGGPSRGPCRRGV